MRIVQLGDLMASKVPSLNPLQFQEENFELWSIPAFDVGTPEKVPGNQIGSAKKVLQPGDVLLSRIVPHIRRSWVVLPSTDGLRQIGSGEWIVFRSIQVNPNYLRHFLVSDVFHSQFMQTVAGVGGSLLRARPEGVREISLPLPPLEEQKRIAAILDQADSLRRLRQRSIKRLNSLGQAIFYEMFEEALSDSNQTSLSDWVSEFRYGTSNKSSLEGYPTLRIPNIVGGVIDLNDLKLVNVTDSEYSRLKLEKGDLLFVRTNGNPSYVGRCSSIDETIGKSGFIYASYLIRARLKNPESAIFIQTYLQTIQGRKQLLENAKTSAGQYNINIDGLSAIRIPEVSQESQLRFIQKIHSIPSLKQNYFFHENKLDCIFSSLQHRAFNGELSE